MDGIKVIPATEFRVRTFDLVEERDVEGHLMLDAPGRAPLFRIQLDDGRVIVRHMSRLTALNDYARKSLEILREED
jgi:hypothetical protein